MQYSEADREARELEGNRGSILCIKKKRNGGAVKQLSEPEEVIGIRHNGGGGDIHAGKVINGEGIRIGWWRQEWRGWATFQ